MFCTDNTTMTYNKSLPNQNCSRQHFDFCACFFFFFFFFFFNVPPRSGEGNIVLHSVLHPYIGPSVTLYSLFVSLQLLLQFCNLHCHKDTDCACAQRSYTSDQITPQPLYNTIVGVHSINRAS